MASKENVISVKFGEKGYEETLLQWADKCDTVLSEESDISHVVNDDTKDRFQIEF